MALVVGLGGGTPGIAAVVGRGGGTPGIALVVGLGGGTPGIAAVVGRGGGTPGMALVVGLGGGTPGIAAVVGRGGGTPGIAFAVTSPLCVGKKCVDGAAAPIVADRARTEPKATHETFHDENMLDTPQCVQRNLLGRLTQRMYVGTTKVPGCLKKIVG
jgi:hypothetical protein